MSWTFELNKCDGGGGGDGYEGLSDKKDNVAIHLVWKLKRKLSKAHKMYCCDDKDVFEICGKRSKINACGHDVHVWTVIDSLTQWINWNLVVATKIHFKNQNFIAATQEQCKINCFKNDIRNLSVCQKIKLN